eukprot:gene7232-5205_t
MHTVKRFKTLCSQSLKANRMDTTLQDLSVLEASIRYLQLNDAGGFYSCQVATQTLDHGEGDIHVKHQRKAYRQAPTLPGAAARRTSRSAESDGDPQCADGTTSGRRRHQRKAYRQAPTLPGAAARRTSRSAESDGDPQCADGTTSGRRRHQRKAYRQAPTLPGAAARRTSRSAESDGDPQCADGTTNERKTENDGKRRKTT